MSPAERGLAALDKADAALVALTDIIGYLEAKQRLVDAAKVAIGEMPQGAARDALEKAIRELRSWMGRGIVATTRRAFLATLAASMGLDADRLLWVPGAKLVSLLYY